MEITDKNIREIIDKSYNAGVTDTVDKIIESLEEFGKYCYVLDKVTGSYIELSKVIKDFKKKMKKKK